MKIIFNCIKKVCLGIFGIYSINVLFSSLSITIPINFFTIFMSSFLGIYGLVTIIAIKLII